MSTAFKNKNTTANPLPEGQQWIEAVVAELHVERMLGGSAQDFTHLPNCAISVLVYLTLKCF